MTFSFSLSRLLLYQLERLHHCASPIEQPHLLEIGQVLAGSSKEKISIVATHHMTSSSSSSYLPRSDAFRQLPSSSPSHHLFMNFFPRSFFSTQCITPPSPFLAAPLKKLFYFVCVCVLDLVNPSFFRNSSNTSSGRGEKGTTIPGAVCKRKEKKKGKVGYTPTHIRGAWMPTILLPFFLVCIRFYSFSFRCGFL